MYTGPVELAAVGISIAIFNQVSRIAIFPLVSVTTSFVAEEDTIAQMDPEEQNSENLEMGTVVSTEDEKLLLTKGMLGSSILVSFYWVSFNGLYNFLILNFCLVFVLRV